MIGRSMRFACAATALSLVACNSSRQSSSGPIGNGGSDGSPEPPARCEEITLRVRGTSPGAVSALGLVLAQVAVSREGTAVQVMGAPLGATLDLAGATDVGRFAVAEGDTPVSVSLSWSGGSSIRDGVSHGLGLCSGPITFTFRPGGLVSSSCTAEVVLNVGRSVVPDEGGLSLIPQYQVFVF